MILFVFLSIIIVVCCFISYAITSTLFTSTTVFLANYSSGNIKTNSIQPVSACLACFEMIWHFFHKWFRIFCSLEPGNPVVQTFDFAHQSVARICISVYLMDAVWLVKHHGLVWLVIIHTVDIMCN